jgi:hypothetical protein
MSVTLLKKPYLSYQAGNQIDHFRKNKINVNSAKV